MNSKEENLHSTEWLTDQNYNLSSSILEMTDAIAKGKNNEILVQILQSFVQNQFGFHVRCLVEATVENDEIVYQTYGSGDSRTCIGLVRRYLSGEIVMPDNVIELAATESVPSYIVLDEPLKNREIRHYIQALGEIISLTIANRRLHNTSLEQARITEELRLAHKVQETLMTQIFPHPQELEVDTLYVPYHEVSGDYYDYLMIDADRVLICIADVSGKGVPAALMMASFQATLRRLVINYKDLSTLVRNINSAIFSNTKGERFISAFFMEYHLKKNELKYINAGHNYPRLIQDDYVWELRTGTSLLGLNRDLLFLEQEVIGINKNSLLFLYTDGLAEMKLDDGSFFEEAELDRFLLKNQNEPADFLNSKIKTYISNHNESIRDDITIFTCKIHPDGIN